MHREGGRDEGEGDEALLLSVSVGQNFCISYFLLYLLLIYLFLLTYTSNQTNQSKRFPLCYCFGELEKLVLLFCLRPVAKLMLFRVRMGPSLLTFPMLKGDQGATF